MEALCPSSLPCYEAYLNNRQCSHDAGNQVHAVCQRAWLQHLWTQSRLTARVLLAGASIVGLQETRSKKAFARKSDAFFMVASAATKAGTDGCELWVATSLKPSSSTVRPIISKPSLLVAALRLSFCSDHRYGGPCSCRAAASECQRQLVE